MAPGSLPRRHWRGVPGAVSGGAGHGAAAGGTLDDAGTAGTGGRGLLYQGQVFSCFVVIKQRDQRTGIAESQKQRNPVLLVY